MILATFIAQLRANAPMFNGRVAGAAEFTRGLRDYSTSLPLPAAYVVPLAQEADPNDSWGGLQQLVHIGVGVIVELDAQNDRRGQAPAMDLDDVREQVWASVLNLQIGDCRMARGTYYTGARSLDLDRARLFYQFEFGADWLITEADGVQVLGVPIQSIELDGFGPHGVPPAGTDPAFIAMIADADAGTLPPPTNGPWPAITAMVQRFRLWRPRRR